MARKQKEWARKQRNILHWLLGSKCCDCGTTEKLSLDCDEPQGDAHHRKMGWDCRMRFYWREYYRGNLKLRCLICNGIKGGSSDKAYHAGRRAVGYATHSNA